MIIADFGPERIDTWVFWIGVAFPVACVVGLVLWHLLASGARKLAGGRRAARESPEPERASSRNDPERMQRACATMEETLAQMYLELAESYLRAGQSQQAADVWQKIIERCPETPQAQEARERVRRRGG
jgi:hypothetical protein